MRTVFTREKIWAMYHRNVGRASKRLTEIPAYCGQRPTFRGLSGWVFEQVIQHCIRKELQTVGINATYSEQYRLVGRATVDLRIDNVLVEMKLSGAYSRESYAKYPKYKKTATENGFSYLWFSGEESYRPYRSMAKKAFGTRNAFYLDTTADWNRFVTRIRDLLKKGWL